MTPASVLKNVTPINSRPTPPTHTIPPYTSPTATPPIPVNPSLTTTPPIPINQSVTTKQNTPVNIILGGNDRNPKAILTAHITSNPLQGTLGTINQNTGVVTYTPKQGFAGNDNITFKVNNGKADSNNIGI